MIRMCADLKTLSVAAGFRICVMPVSLNLNRSLESFPFRTKKGRLSLSGLSFSFSFINMPSDEGVPCRIDDDGTIDGIPGNVKKEYICQIGGIKVF